MNNKLRFCLFFLCLLIAGCLIPFPESWSNIFLRELSTCLHFPLFFLACLSFIGLFAWRGLKRMRLLALLSSTALAAAIELIQPLFSRSASTRDFLLGFLGIAAAAIGSLLWGPLGTRICRIFYGTALIALSLLVFSPAASKLETLFWASRVFPLLADFETPKELDFWRLNQSALTNNSSFARSEEFASSGKNSLRVALRGSDWPAIIYRGAKDWRGFSQLEFEVFNPGPAFKLGLRVDDYEDCSLHDNRFNQTLDIGSGRNKLEISLAQIESGPRDRLLNMDSISQLVFFLPEREKETAFFLDSLRLDN